MADIINDSFRDAEDLMKVLTNNELLGIGSVGPSTAKFFKEKFMNIWAKNFLKLDIGEIWDLVKKGKRRCFIDVINDWEC